MSMGTPLRKARAWWGARNPSARQRIVLGAMLVGAVALRDLLLVAFAGSLFGVLELARVQRASAPAAVPAK